MDRTVELEAKVAELKESYHAKSKEALDYRDYVKRYSESQKTVVSLKNEIDSYVDDLAAAAGRIRNLEIKVSTLEQQIATDAPYVAFGKNFKQLLDQI